MYAFTANNPKLPTPPHPKPQLKWRHRSTNPLPTKLPYLPSVPSACAKQVKQRKKTQAKKEDRQDRSYRSERYTVTLERKSLFEFCPPPVRLASLGFMHTNRPNKQPGITRTRGAERERERARALLGARPSGVIQFRNTTTLGYLNMNTMKHFPSNN